MALDDEKRAELEESVTSMRMLDEMVKTDGWQKIIIPTFIALRESYFAKLLNAETLPELYKAQCAIKSLNVILSDKKRKIVSDVDAQIQEGIEAVETLSKDKEPEEDKE